jgi:transcriptional regulator with XRE-family HTH domain
MPTFGETLRRLREEAGLSQKALADRAGTSQKAVSFWESGDREPALSSIQKLCTALGVGCEVFFESDRPAAAVKRGKRK